MSDKQAYSFEESFSVVLIDNIVEENPGAVQAQAMGIVKLSFDKSVPGRSGMRFGAKAVSGRHAP